MRIEIHPHNEQKILEASQKLGLSTTEVVNQIIDAANIVIQTQIQKVDFNFTKVIVEKRKDKKIITKGGKNFATDF